MIIFSRATIIFVFSLASVMGYECTAPEIVREFEQGDLLYGLQKPAREKYLPFIQSKMEAIPNNTFVHVETVSKTLLPAESKRSLPRPIFRAKKLVYVTADVYNASFGRSQMTSLDEQYIAYMKECASLKLDILEKLGAQGLIDDDSVIKFLCKKAIDYTIAQGYKIRFLLDGLNLYDALNKSGRYGSSFTASELRYIRRNWDRLKDYVIFYQNGSKLDQAPWEFLSKQGILGDTDDTPHVPREAGTLAVQEDLEENLESKKSSKPPKPSIDLVTPNHLSLKTKRHAMFSVGIKDRRFKP